MKRVSVALHTALRNAYETALTGEGSEDKPTLPLPPPPVTPRNPGNPGNPGRVIT